MFVKKKIFFLQVELGLEGAWGYHNGLLHRVFMWYLLDEYDKAMNDARHLASFFGRYEAFFSSIPNRTFRINKN